MSSPATSTATMTGLFLNPVGQRRVDFQALCGDQFGKLFVADGVEQAGELLGQQPVDLLIVDLDRFDLDFDVPHLRRLLSQSGVQRTLILCPFQHARWIVELADYGRVSYAIMPLLDQDLRAAVGAQLGGAATQAAQVSQLRELSAATTRVRQAIAESDDIERMAERVCTALCSLPGVVHAAVFHMPELGDLALEAQHATRGLNLLRILKRSDRLMHSPLRNAFPGLLAASSGEMALLDVAAKAGEPEMAMELNDNGIGAVLGLPLPPSRTGAMRGALCLLFDHARQFSSDEMAAYTGMAQLAGFGLRLAEVCRENEQLLGRVTHMATVDTMTGAFNRRQGEYLLELEARRALRYKLPVALIAFDLDRFKAINDQFGHPVGDAVIRAVADAARAILRNSDMLIRSAGDEFCIVAPHTSAIDALKVAEKLRVHIAQTEVPGCDRVTISLGVGQLSEQESPDALMVRVDAALARAKRAGRNCVELAMS
ncbi:diguanylate cyclase [Massilia sp. CF038]|uniref:GGDEF domain-containing protein n=1 Tax=Massilia sp. CF038 TaxID=1881045 RepID=UPI0009135A9B|nr:GGDEF domain-containing protein [Massilia sp. CF038]SHH00220.1 diguanylate cyclase (GGDEF) domain-containing protein [Massilia sp. CF038]